MHLYPKLLKSLINKAVLGHNRQNLYVVGFDTIIQSVTDQIISIVLRVVKHCELLKLWGSKSKLIFGHERYAVFTTPQDETIFILSPSKKYFHHSQDGMVGSIQYTMSGQLLPHFYSIEQSRLVRSHYACFPSPSLMTSPCTSRLFS